MYTTESVVQTSGISLSLFTTHYIYLYITQTSCIVETHLLVATRKDSHWLLILIFYLSLTVDIN
jgi:lipoprotein signal peptidase